MRILLFALSTFILASCGGGNSSAPYVLKGKVNGASGQMVYLSNFINNVPNRLDSAQVGEDGSFELGMANPALDFYQVALNDQDFCIIITDSTEQGVYVEADAGNMMKSYAVTGSKQTALLVDFYRTSDEFEANREEMRIEYEAVSGSGDTSRIMDVQERVITLGNTYYEYLTNTIRENPGSPVCLSILGKLDPRNELELYKLAEMNLRKTMPNSPYVQSLAQQISTLEQQAEAMRLQQEEAERMANLLKQGTEAPEINMATPQGEPMPLSSLRGKIVLIDFWASWCKPCRAENPNVVKLYNKYKGAGFDIYGVSLDKSKDAWVQAIQQDGLSWHHVSDLGFWNSAAAKLYGVNSIPFTVLLDKEGKVIETRLRGAALEQKLEEIFGF